VLSLIAALALSSPVPTCAWWSRSERRCRDADVEIVGPWDPRPLDWSGGYSMPNPPEWGTYKLEKDPLP
jgi:hypothetical protein